MDLLKNAENAGGVWKETGRSMSILNDQFSKKLPRPGKTGLDWYIYDKIVKNYSDEPMLEIGVGHGGSLLTLLDHTNDVYAIDPWFGYEPIYFDNVKYIEKDSKDLKPENLPFVTLSHLDGDKKLTYNDLELVSAITTDVIIVDDYFHRKWPEVTWQVTEFLKDDLDWKINTIGDHSVVLTRNIVDFNIGIPAWPSHIRTGDLPKEAEPFIRYGKMKHAWHESDFEDL